MERLVWALVLLCLAGVVVSLGSALVHLSRDSPADSDKLVRALTVRITLSLVLFVLLMLAWYFGLISPHAFGGGPPPR
jgi:lipopolysaccharide export LptBFGC system permease protein LptF